MTATDHMTLAKLDLATRETDSGCTFVRTVRVGTDIGIVTIPRGFVSDYASHPLASIGLFQGPQSSRVPGVIHDALYSFKSADCHPVSRGQADACFKRLLVAHGMGRIRASAWYLSLRLFGGFAWRAKERSRKHYDSLILNA